METQNWKIKCNWIKAHPGHHGIELADQTAKEAATNSDINEYKEYSEARIKRLQCNKVAKRMGHYNKRCNYENLFPKNNRQVKT